LSYTAWDIFSKTHRVTLPLIQRSSFFCFFDLFGQVGESQAWLSQEKKGFQRQKVGDSQTVHPTKLSTLLGRSARNRKKTYCSIFSSFKILPTIQKLNS
jgi:hypothetical protein